SDGKPVEANIVGHYRQRQTTNYRTKWGGKIYTLEPSSRSVTTQPGPGFVSRGGKHRLTGSRKRFRWRRWPNPTGNLSAGRWGYGSRANPACNIRSISATRRTAAS